MRRLMRAGIVTATGALAMAMAGTALAAVNPRLVIGTQPASTTLSIGARVNQNDDAVHRIQVFIPNGFQVRAPVGGSTVGTASAEALSTQVAGGAPGNPVPSAQIYKMTGGVTAIGTNDPAVAWENANCSSGPHQAAWMVNLIGGDVRWSFPIFVQQTSGAEAAFGTHKLVACFRPIFGPNMDAFGNKLVSLNLSLNAFAAAPRTGTFRWRSLFTPYGALGQNPNQAGTVEAQSIVTIPSAVLTLNASRNGRVVTLRGTAIVGGEALANAVIHLRHGMTRQKLVGMGSFRTNRSGTFVKRVWLAKRPHVYRVGTNIGPTNLGHEACTASFGAAVPCISASAGRVGIVSRFVTFGR